MVVKRQKSNTDVNGKTVAVTNRGSGSGALIQAVSSSTSQQLQTSLERVLNCHEKEAG